MTNGQYHTEWEKLEACLLRSRTRHGCPLSSLLYNTVWKLQPEPLGKKKSKGYRLKGASQTTPVCRWHGSTEGNQKILLRDY